MTSENLTHIERLALHSPINLADGHARQSLHPATMSAVVERFSALMSAPVDVTEIEGEFLDALTARSGVPYNRPRTWISYSASIAIDIVAKLLTRRGLRVGLVAPTFDNLSALIERNGTELVAVPEEWLTPTVDFDRLMSLGLSALFVVQPNNPTGTSWSQGTWEDVCTWAAREPHPARRRHVLPPVRPRDVLGPARARRADRSLAHPHRGHRQDRARCTTPRWASSPAPRISRWSSGRSMRTSS